MLRREISRLLGACAFVGMTTFAMPALAAPVTVDFTGLPDNVLGNGEVNGTEFLGQGLSLTTLGGSTFNVGCGTGTSCLGADLSFQDFNGTIQGTFVDGSLAPVTVTSLAIDLCCEGNTGLTTTTLYSSSNAVLATFIGTDVSYVGSPVARFVTTFGFDAMYTLTYDGVAAVPEPASLLLLGSGIATVIARRNRRRR